MTLLLWRFQAINCRKGDANDHKDGRAFLLECFKLWEGDQCGSLQGDYGLPGERV